MSTYPVPTFEALVANYLRDISNQLPDAAVGPDSDYSVRGAASSAAVEGLFAHQQWVFNQIFPDLMDFDNLLVFGAQRGVFLRLATPMTGSITFTGSFGAVIPVGTLAQFNGVAYQTTTTGNISTGGSAVLACVAVVAGTAGNGVAGSALTLSAAPSNINSAAVLTVANGDGTDTETQAAYLARVLYRLQNPPQGGSEADYEIWATNTPGCGYAFVYGQRTLANSVDIVILDANHNLPTPGLVAAVQANINANRPVCANNSVVSGAAPVVVPVTAVLVLSPGAVLGTVELACSVALVAYFSTLNPKSSLIYNELVGLIMGVAGVSDVVFTTPTANIAPLFNASTIQMLTLGPVNIT